MSIISAQQLMQSPLYNEFPIKARLILYYCQLFYIEELSFFDPGSDFFNLFDSFDKEFDPNQIHDSKLVLFYYTIKIQLLLYKAEIDQAMNLQVLTEKLVSKSKALYETDNEAKKYVALFYLVYSKILRRAKNIEKELSYLLNSFELWNQIGSYYYRYLCIIEISRYYGRNQKKDVRLQFLEQNYDYFIKDQKAHPLYARYMLTQLADLYLRFDLLTASKYISQALDDSNSLRFDTEKELFFRLSASYLIKGIICALMGDIEGSLEANTISLDQTKQLQLYFNQISSRYALELGNMGETVAESGDLNKALEYQLEALNIRKKAYESKLSHLFTSVYVLSESYYQLIQLQLRLEHFEEAKNYLQKFEQVTQNIEPTNALHRTILIQYKLAKGLIALSNTSIEDLAHAKTLLKEVIDENFKFELIVDALIPLIDISIQEYKVFQNPKNYQEIISLVRQLEELGEINDSIPLKIHSILVSGKMELIKGNIEQADELYRKALSIAKLFKNSDLIKKTQRELDKMKTELGNWEKILLNTSFKERLDLLEFESYINEGKKYVTIKKISQKTS